MSRIQLGFHRRIPIAQGALLGIFVLLASVGQTALGRSEDDTIAVKDIKPGMKGFGLSVFRGTRPERFDVEVIDILPNFRPGQDIILVRTPHPLLDQTQAVAGMSGSPIYLEGRLAGAYAYGWPFGKEPIVGVTPIANMLSELARPIDPEIWRILGPVPTKTTQDPTRARDKASKPKKHASLPFYRDHQPRDASWALRMLAREPQFTSAVGPTPALTPIMLSGMDDAAAKLLAKELSPFGLVPMQAGGASTTPRTSMAAAGYENGSAIGVQLIGGDISATAVGTVTHVQGRRLVAFGHPMMNAGQTAMPTTTAEIVHVLASLQRSFKMARPVKTLGAMIQDRQSTIVVDAKLKAATIPVRIQVHEQQTTAELKNTWNLELASNRSLTPILLFSAMINALQASAADRSDAVVRAETLIKLSGDRKLQLSDVTYMPGGTGNPFGLSAMRLFSAVEAAYGNPFERTYLDSVEVDLYVRVSDEIAEIINVRVPYREVDPGADVTAYITLRDFNGSERDVAATIHVPKSAAGQHIELQIDSGDNVKPELPRPRSVDDLLDGLKAFYSPTSLIVSTKLPSSGLRMRGYVVPRLPDSVLSSLNTQSESDSSPTFSDYARTEIPGHQVLQGSAKVQLDVREQAQ